MENVVEKKEQKNEKELITKKDLIYWLVIIVLFNIVIMTRFWGESTDLVSKLSFAGTLSSIILAVIAIIISVVQGVLFQSSYDKLVDVTDRIVQISDNNEKTSKKFSVSADRISESAQQLESIQNGIETLKGSQQTLDDKFNNLLGRSSSEPAIYNFKYTKDELIPLFETNHNLLLILFYIYNCYCHKMPITNNLKKFLQNQQIDSFDTRFGLFMGVLNSFETLSGIKKDYDGKIESFDENLLAAIDEINKKEKAKGFESSIVEKFRFVEKLFS